MTFTYTLYIVGKTYSNRQLAVIIWPRSKIERKQKKKGNKVPDQRSKENRRNMQKGLLDQTTSDQIQSYYQVKKKRETTTWSGPLPLIANQNPVHRWLVRLTLNKNRKGKGQKHSKPKFPPKNPIPKKKSY